MPMRALRVAVHAAGDPGGEHLGGQFVAPKLALRNC